MRCKRSFAFSTRLATGNLTRKKFLPESRPFSAKKTGFKPKSNMLRIHFHTNTPTRAWTPARSTHAHTRTHKHTSTHTHTPICAHTHKHPHSASDWNLTNRLGCLYFRQNQFSNSFTQEINEQGGYASLPLFLATPLSFDGLHLYKQIGRLCFRRPSLVCRCLSSCS